MKNYSCLAIGVMSGTSLDGVDLCLSEFHYTDNKWSFKLLKSKTYPYPIDLKKRLVYSPSLSASNFLALDHELGLYFAQLINNFITEFKIEKSKLHLIGSHGHTLYHKPKLGITTQIGNGPEIFIKTGINTVCDFRKQDIALGGQGAPLVPIGDQLLFDQYDACVNLGGFANISFTNKQKRVAYDICPLNFVLNTLAQKLGQPYDSYGNIAKEGTLDNGLLEKLNQLEYYKLKAPKSLGAEWVEKHITPLINSRALDASTLLRTLTEHMSLQIANSLNEVAAKTCLVSGGGAYNQFLISKVIEHTHCSIEIADAEILEFKEALIFAFLGVLRWNKQINTLASATGAKYDHSAGVIYSS